MNMNLFKLNPHLVQKIWGGSKLASVKGATTLGEAWEFSTLEAASSTVLSGEELGSMAAVRIEQLFGKIDLSQFLIKFIDTKFDLSIQVHPDNSYAQKHENSTGKTECWIILAAEPGAGVYLGFNETVNRDEFYQDVKESRDVSKYLQFREVKSGDFFLVPAGTIHAIGKGITLLEVQESSGITYRVWDWNRVDELGAGRALHIKSAMDVLLFDSKDNEEERFLYQNVSGVESIFDHEKFSLKGVSGTREFQDSGYKRPHVFVNLTGTTHLSMGIESIELGPMESVLVSFKNYDKVIIKCEEKGIWVC